MNGQTHYYGAVVDYGQEADIFVCRLLIHPDEEVTLDFKRLGRPAAGHANAIPENQQLTFSEEIRILGASSIPKKRLGHSIESEIESALREALGTTDIQVRRLRTENLDDLF